MRFSTLAPEVRSENTYGLNMQFFFSRRFAPVRDWSLTRLLRELSVSIQTKNILWNPV